VISGRIAGQSLPVVSYTLVLFALRMLLRPVLAPRAAAADRDRVHNLLKTWGRNHISHLAVHGATSYHWFDEEGCVAYALRGRVALALGDPIGPPDIARRGLESFVSYWAGRIGYQPFTRWTVSATIASSLSRWCRSDLKR